MIQEGAMTLKLVKHLQELLRLAQRAMRQTRRWNDAVGIASVEMKKLHIMIGKIVNVRAVVASIDLKVTRNLKPARGMSLRMSHRTLKSQDAGNI